VSEITNHIARTACQKQMKQNGNTSQKGVKDSARLRIAPASKRTGQKKGSAKKIKKKKGGVATPARGEKGGALGLAIGNVGW